MSDAPVTTPKSMIARQIGPDDKGARGFLVWLKASMPGVYSGIRKDLERLNVQGMSASLSGLGAFGDTQPGTDVPASSAPASSSWSDTVSKLIQAYGQYKLTQQQLDTLKKVTDANLQRAQAGLAPLPYDSQQLGLAPTVQIGLTGGTSKMLFYGGAAILALLAFGMMGRRRST